MSLDKSLLIAPELIVPVGDPTPTSRINIAGYTLKNYKIFNPEGYQIICQTSNFCDGLSFFPRLINSF